MLTRTMPDSVIAYARVFTTVGTKIGAITFCCVAFTMPIGTVWKFAYRTILELLCEAATLLPEEDATLDAVTEAEEAEEAEAEADAEEEVEMEADAELPDVGVLVLDAEEAMGKVELLSAADAVETGAGVTSGSSPPHAASMETAMAIARS